MATTLIDLRDARRQWLRSPGITAVAFLSLVLGIGANVALFTLVNALLLATLPVRDPQSLVRVTAVTGASSGDIGFANREWEYFRAHQTMVESVFSGASQRLTVSLQGGEPREVSSGVVTGNAFDVLGVQPAIGRTLGPADDEPSAARVAMVGYGFWQRQFGGAPDVVGRTIRIGEVPFEIVGVAPPRFFGLEVGRVWDVMTTVASYHVVSPSPADPRFEPQWMMVYGRLPAGRTVQEVSAELRAWYPTFKQALLPPGISPERYMPYPFEFTSAARGLSFLRQQYGRSLVVLLSAVGAVLLIACVNLSALVLARFSDRQHEFGVRLSLGASRARLLRALVTETTLLAVAAAALGLVVAQWLAHAVIPFLAFSRFDTVVNLDLAIDPRVLGVTLAFALGTAMISGIFPALLTTRVSPLASLGAATRGGTQGRRSSRVMRVLAGAQMAMALVLVTGAALLVRTFVELTTRPNGLETDRVLIAAVRGDLGTTPAARQARIEELARELSQVAGVSAVSAAMFTPLSGGVVAGELRVPGAPPDRQPRGFAPFNRILPGFFAVVGTPLVAGRDFDARDTLVSPKVAIVNEAFADRYYPGQNPVGRILMFGTTPMEIVGIAGNSRMMSLREERDVPLAYTAMAQWPASSQGVRFAMRVTDVVAAQAAVATRFRTLEPRIIVELRTMRDDGLASITRERLLAWTAGLLALLGLVMSLVGLYGTFTYAVRRRRIEMGVRLAVGAMPRDILRLVMRDAALSVAAGAMAGIAIAAASTRLLAGLLFGIGARDPVSYAAALAALASAALIATYLPARRASRIDPVSALRQE